MLAGLPSCSILRYSQGELREGPGKVPGPIAKTAHAERRTHANPSIHARGKEGHRTETQRGTAKYPNLDSFAVSDFFSRIPCQSQALVLVDPQKPNEYVTTPRPMQRPLPSLTIASQ